MLSRALLHPLVKVLRELASSIIINPIAPRVEQPHPFLLLVTGGYPAAVALKGHQFDHDLALFAISSGDTTGLGLGVGQI